MEAEPLLADLPELAHETGPQSDEGSDILAAHAAQADIPVGPNAYDASLVSCRPHRSSD